MAASRSCNLQAADFETGPDSAPQLTAASRGPRRLSDPPRRSHGKPGAATSVALLTLAPGLPARRTSPLGGPPRPPSESRRECRSGNVTGPRERGPRALSDGTVCFYFPAPDYGRTVSESQPRRGWPWRWRRGQWPGGPAGPARRPLPLLPALHTDSGGVAGGDPAGAPHL